MFAKNFSDLERIERSTTYFCEILSRKDLEECANEIGLRQDYYTVVNEIFSKNTYSTLDFPQFILEYFPTLISLASILVKLTEFYL